MDGGRGMGMRLHNTATERTYRYVRLSIVGAVVLLGVGIAVATWVDGPLGSVSATYYSSAHDVFVGSIFAIAISLVALSGDSLEQVLLDYMAICAPVIAVVPPLIAAGEVPGSTCPETAPCIPSVFLPQIWTATTSLVIVGVLGVLLALVLTVVQGRMTPARGLALAGAAAIVVTFGLWAWLAPASYLAGAHVTAASIFFGLIVVIAVFSAIRAYRVCRTPRGGTVYRTLYTAVATGIALAVLFLLTVIALTLAGVEAVVNSPVPLVFVGEVVALGLFAVFWTTQTIQLWDGEPERSDAG
ncbi:hypothetical protein ABCS02_20580 [Microbacterium sp. X-17]|uniref:hypothetical protein n=1 Tax=Microbacterium sp. X-17 TaxID=3144404 RepID=UPI0031F59D22